MPIVLASPSENRIAPSPVLGGVAIAIRTWDMFAHPERHALPAVAATCGICARISAPAEPGKLTLSVCATRL
ncbi:MAG: hypothetical protein KJN93_08950 [Alphaproteobacteria bacterium]|nr:hypothetical protein [Alphaproteobacteria bacterium]NNF23491.1 hypothetical protein [Paracoccaceae bacterium]